VSAPAFRGTPPISRSSWPAPSSGTITPACRCAPTTRPSYPSSSAVMRRESTQLLSTLALAKTPSSRLVAYNSNNLAGGGCQDADCGMIVCCSHAGYRTAREVIDCSANPVIFSHSNPRALRDHARNIPDDLMRSCAARGWVIGINGIDLFLDENRPMSRHIRL
jgi:Membrane dipeptidase (Peptidase family M19)